jgi:hypothetical protein
VEGHKILFSYKGNYAQAQCSCGWNSKKYLQDMEGNTAFTKEIHRHRSIAGQKK